MGREIYSSLISPARLRLPDSAFPPMLFLDGAFLTAALLRGVPPLLDLVGAEMLKWPAVPEALAVLRILKMRSEIARGVGRSRPVADASCFV